MHAQSNIYLIGFMGTGKSAVGRLLAQQLGMRFVDMDDCIVERARKPIPRIFAEDGEPHFRKLERTIARELSGLSGLVVATGGGVVLDEANMHDFYSSGTVVCLSAAPDCILDRVEGDTNRPLLSGTREEKMAKMMALLARRQALYDAVPNQIDTSAISVDAVCDLIVAMHSEHRGVPG